MTKHTENVSIDDALAETKFGKFNYILIFISGLILVNVVLECVGVSFVLPVINCDMDLSYTKKGILGAVSFLGIISSSHLWGFLADTMGRRNVIRPTLFAGYVVTVISSFSPDFWTLVISRYINGFLISGGSATVYAYLGEFHCNKFRNRALMTSAFISAATSFFFPIMAWAIINQHWSFEVPVLNITYTPWRMFILLAGTFGLICGLCLLFLPESPKYLLSIGEEEAALKVLRKVYSINSGKNHDSFKIKSIRPDNEDIQRLKLKNGKKLSALVDSMWNQTVPLFRREYRRNTVLACFMEFWIFYTAHGLYMWFPYILNNVMQFIKTNPSVRLEICDIVYSMAEPSNDNFSNSTDSDSQSKNGCVKVLELSTYEHTISLELIYIGLFLCSGYFTGKVGRSPTLFIVLFVCGTCGVFSAFITTPIIAVYFHIVFLVCGIATTVISIIIVDIFPTNLRAMAVCISLMVGRIGSVAGTNVTGMLIEHHCKTSLLTASIPMVICAFLSLFLPSGIDPKKVKQSDKMDAA